MPGYIPRQLLDQFPVDNSEPTYRMSMMPFGTYPNQDGQGEHLGFALPGMIQEPINALMRLGQNSMFDDGRLGIPNPENLDNQHDTSMLVESLFGGNAARGAGAGKAAAESAALTPVARAPVPDFPAADLTAPFRAFHGTSADVAGQFRPSESGTFGPAFYAAYDDPRGYGHGADFAGTFARAPSGGNHSGIGAAFDDGARIYPLDIDGRIATADQFSKAFDEAAGSTTAERRAAAADLLRQQGFDGAGVDGELGLWNRGTVKSPLTGETLFSGGPSLWGNALSQDQNDPRNSFFNY